jgi:hypothetical protein
MSGTSVYNTSGSPLLIDEAGHVLAAGEHGDVNVNVDPAKSHVAAGRLLINDVPEADPAPVIEAKAGKPATATKEG